MKYFKMVSGKGRVPMTEAEISDFLTKSDEHISNEETPLERLEKRVDILSKTIEALSKTDIFKALLSFGERAEDENGAS